MTKNEKTHNDINEDNDGNFLQVNKTNNVTGSLEKMDGMDRGNIHRITSVKKNNLDGNIDLNVGENRGVKEIREKVKGLEIKTLDKLKADKFNKLAELAEIAEVVEVITKPITRKLQINQPHKVEKDVNKEVDNKDKEVDKVVDKVVDIEIDNKDKENLLINPHGKLNIINKLSIDKGEKEVIKEFTKEVGIDIKKDVEKQVDKEAKEITITKERTKDIDKEELTLNTPPIIKENTNLDYIIEDYILKDNKDINKDIDKNIEDINTNKIVCYNLKY